MLIIGTGLPPNATMTTASNQTSTQLTDATLQRAYDALGLKYTHHQQQGASGIIIPGTSGV